MVVAKPSMIEYCLAQQRDLNRKKTALDKQCYWVKNHFAYNRSHLVSESFCDMDAPDGLIEADIHSTVIVLLLIVHLKPVCMPKWSPGKLQVLKVSRLAR